MLFTIADIVLWIFLLSSISAMIAIIFTAVSLAFLAGGDSSDAITNLLIVVMGLPQPSALTFFMLLVGLLSALVYLFSYILLLTKRVLGLFIMVILDLLSLLLWPMDPAFVTVAAFRWLILGLPWLLMWIDLKRRGTLA